MLQFIATFFQLNVMQLVGKDSMEAVIEVLRKVRFYFDGLFFGKACSTIHSRKVLLKA